MRRCIKKRNDRTVRISVKRGKHSRTTTHGMFGHICSNVASEVCEYLGYKISRGSMKLCPQCRESKAKKEPIPKISEKAQAPYLMS